MPNTKPDLGQIGERASSTTDNRETEQKAYDKPPTRPQLENQRFAQETAYLRKENRLRLWSAIALFVVVLIWLGAVLWLVVWQAEQPPKWRLSDPVLMVLLGTTTVNVIGLLLAVTRYLFPSRPERLEESTKRKQRRPKQT